MEKHKTAVQKNKLKITTASWNYNFELPDCSYTMLHNKDYVEYIKNMKHYQLTMLFIYNNRINNRLVFEIKDEYKLELQTHEVTW